jgi:hypothetical protein
MTRIDPDGLRPYETRDLRLRQGAKFLAVEALAWARVAREAIESEDYLRFGFENVRDYFDQRVGVAYRTAAKYIAVVNALDALPPAVQPRAQTAIAEIGIHRAAVLAPVLTAKTWERWVAQAAISREAALQEAVSASLGREQRGGLPDNPGERAYRHLLHYLPDEERDRFDRVFRAAMKVAETDNPVRVWLLMIGLLEADLVAQGVKV